MGDLTLRALDSQRDRRAGVYVENGSGTFVTIVYIDDEGRRRTLGGFARELAEQPTSPNKITRAPGNWILHAADLLFSPSTVENLFEAAIADLRQEHFDALYQGRLWKARISLLRGYGALVVNALIHGLSGILRLVREAKEVVD